MDDANQWGKLIFDKSDSCTRIRKVRTQGVICFAKVEVDGTCVYYVHWGRLADSWSRNLDCWDICIFDHNAGRYAHLIAGSRIDAGESLLDHEGGVF